MIDKVLYPHGLWASTRRPDELDGLLDDAMLRVVGVDRLVHGTDRPVVEPPSLALLGPAFRHAVTRVNPARVLS